MSKYAVKTLYPDGVESPYRAVALPMFASLCLTVGALLVLAAFLPDRQYITLMRYERYGIVVLLVLSFVGIGSSLISRGILGIYSALLSLIFG